MFLKYFHVAADNLQLATFPIWLATKKEHPRCVAYNPLVLFRTDFILYLFYFYITDFTE